MCGICGAYGYSDKYVVKKMCDMIEHRGPDAEGYYNDDHIMLGMRRLKVIDLETGNQPIFNEDESVVVVYNGEIYNFEYLRDDLGEKGHTFSTHSDTEVLVHLYEEYGENFVKKLRGMFAFALWDSKEEQLLIARDRIGIKPLYYYDRDNLFAFASEIKSLFAIPSVSKELNFSALHDYLTYLYVPAPETIFKNIHKLLPGNMLVYKNRKVSTKQYWDIDNGDFEYDKLVGNHEDELAEHLLGLMKESVKMHLISDVPLGVFLSGGTDSGSMVSLASEFSNKPIKTFSVGFEDSYYNELDNARLVANMYKTDHHEFIVKPANLDQLDDILGFFDEPFADSSAIPTYFVSKCAREKVTVALSGDGGDEVFGGYGNYKADKMVHYYRKLPGILKTRIIPFLINRLPGNQNSLSVTQQLKKLIKTAEYNPEYGHVSWLSVFNGKTKEILYKNRELEKLIELDSLDKYCSYSDNFAKNDFINNFINVDIKTVLPDDYLTKVDRMSMANSLEVRVPFLDHKLLEFATSIPGKFKLRGLNTKYLLKKIMKDKLPQEILNGKKKGFSIPLQKWFKEDFSKLIERYLSKEIIKKRGYFDCDTVSMLANEHSCQKKDNSKFLWTLICFEVWHRRFL